MVNNEILISALPSTERRSDPVLTATDPAEGTATGRARHPDEAADVARMRELPHPGGGKTYRLLRGDFHRHTEISQDGGNDGALEDMWRYAIDAADFDWMGNNDHDNGGGKEYTWWLDPEDHRPVSQPVRFHADVHLRAEQRLSPRPPQRDVRAARDPHAAPADGQDEGSSTRTPRCSTTT